MIHIMTYVVFCRRNNNITRSVHNTITRLKSGQKCWKQTIDDVRFQIVTKCVRWTNLFSMVGLFLIRLRRNFLYLFLTHGKVTHNYCINGVKNSLIITVETEICMNNGNGINFNLTAH